jgi:hypothetical protein
VSETREEYNARKQRWRDANRGRYRATSNKFARSDKGQKHRKQWRDEHPENIRAATYRYRAKMSPEQRKQIAKKHRDNPITKLKRKLREAEKRAERDGGFFDHALYELVLSNPPTHCACCSIALDYNTEGRGCRNRGPSVDRVINDRWYTIENTRFTCGRCNAIKSDGTVEEHELIVAYIRRES